MHVIILAAGYGTRLGSSTEHTPKPLLIVGNRPIIDRILDLIRPLPYIQHVTVITNAKYYPHFHEWREQFMELQNLPFTLKVLNDGTLTNEARLGPIGDIVFAMKTIDLQDNLIILGGDNAFDTDMHALVAKQKELDTNILGVHTFTSVKEVAGKYGVVKVDQAGRLLEFEEKPQQPQTSIAATAVYVIRKQDVHELAELYSELHAGEINAGEFFKHLLVKNLPVYCVDIPVWFDIGTQYDWDVADKYFLRKEQR